jgi:hypothetical protein
MKHNSVQTVELPCTAPQTRKMNRKINLIGITITMTTTTEEAAELDCLSPV